jgi:6-phosphofructokinase 1
MPESFMKPGENDLSDEGLAYFRRLIPEKFETGKPFV